MMNKYKKLLGDSLIFAIGYLGSRVISFVMLPLYTYKLSTSEYGTVDLVLTTVSFLLPVISLSIFDAVLRFAMDSGSDHKKVLTNSFALTSVSALVLLVVSFILFFVNRLYFFLVLLLILQSFQSLFQQYANGIGKLKVFASNGVVLSFLTALLNIIFLIPLNMGLYGYLISNCLAFFISNIYLAVRLKIKSSLDKELLDWSFLKEMIHYSLPLIPNSVTWWVTTAVGRYFILFFIGTAGNGLYAVSNKIPTLLTVFTSIFAQSWQLSAIDSFDSKGREDFFSNVYNSYSQLMIIGCAGIMLFLKPIFHLLVSPTFFSAWEYAPFLLLSVITSSLSSFLGSQYVAAKETMGILKTTILGGVLTILLNIVLVPTMGVNGVGLGSFISFFAVWVVRERDLQKFFAFKMDKLRFYLSMLAILGQYLALILLSNWQLYAVNGLLFALILFINFSVVNKAISQVLKRGQL